MDQKKHELIDSLRDPSVMVVLSYALTGLGHLRVTDALYHGLPAGVKPLTLHSQDASISYIHRIMSISTLTRMILEWTQRGFAEKTFTNTYRYHLRSQTGLLKKQVLTLLNIRYNPPKHVLFITTHFFLAHQLASIKKNIEQETGMKVSVIVQVTDDSPQQFWYVAGADLTLVPSHKTRIALQKYGRKNKLPETHFVVAPYPISPYLAGPCSQARMHDREMQLSPDRPDLIHVSVPVSGAAVGLAYFKTLISDLHARENGFRFHVISKDAPFTESFLKSMRHRPYVSVESSDSDKRVVEAYEQLYRDTTIALEITKPSEQAFKTLATPKQNGGAIMLFSTPVGRQEHDNVDFMRRHWLIPTKDETELLWDMARHDAVMDGTVAPLISKMCHYRGIRIPSKSPEAVQFIHWCYRRGVFLQMVDYKHASHTGENHKDEIGADGVKRFWETVVKKLLK